MNGFLETARVVFYSNTIYRTNTILGMVRKFVNLVIPLFVWQALYAASGSEIVNGKSLGDMVVYVLVSQVCTALMTADFAETIEKRMKTGVIEYNFIRPMTTRLIFVAESLGLSFYNLVITFVPALIIGAILFPMLRVSVSPVILPFFLFSLLLGYLISVLFELLKGMFAFWFVNVFILNWFLDLFYVLLSGAYVPLWFFPDWLRVVSRFLPFQAAYFLPVEIFLGDRNIAGCLIALLVQFTWITILWIAQEIMWRKSVRKLTVLGG